MPNHLSKFSAVGMVGLLMLSQLQGAPRLIVLIQEGLGHEILNGARLYSEEPELWDWRLDHQWVYGSLSTLPLTTNTGPDGSDPDATTEYDPLQAWNGSISKAQESSSVSAKRSAFSGYQWLIENATDRLQIATAIGSGFPSYKTAINWLTYPNKSGSPVPPTQQLLEWADYHGLKAGIISDMPFSHGMNTILSGARSKDEESAISRFDYVVESSPIDLYVAAGHPRYNELGQALNSPRYTFCTQDDWKELRSKTRENGWNLIFGDENLMGISAQSKKVDQRRLVILQFGDTTSTDAIATDASGLSENLATSLRFQIKMALDHLNKSTDGFVLVIHLGRLPYFLNAELQKESLQEIINSLRTLTTVEDWIEENDGWNETSLILASAYEYGLIWGSNSSSFPYSQLTNRGKKRIPGFRLNHKGPSASLAPLLVKGALARKLDEAYEGSDPIYGDYLPAAKFGSLLKQIVGSADSRIE